MIRPPIRILYINLSDQTSEIKVHSDLAGYFGGVGVSTALLSRHFDDGEVPQKRTSAADPFVLAIGPFCGVFPSCSQTAVSFTSPLTGGLGESFAGGQLGVGLRGIGLDGVFVSGKARKPQVLVIGNGQVEFITTDLWGMRTKEATAVLSERYPDSSVAVIGPAGEAGVRFSQVLVDRFFHFRRLGLGALWGKKKIKGLVVRGGGANLPSGLAALSGSGEELFRELGDPRPEGLKFGIQQEAERTWLLEVESKGLPAFNFNQIGEGYEDLGRRVFSSLARESCGQCPIACRGVSTCEQGKVSVDFQSLASLGPLLGLEDVEELLSLLFLVEDLGMDPISLGGCLAFLTEKEGWKFGDLESYRSLVEALAVRKEDWAKSLSLGLLRVAKGKDRDLAVSFSGLEALPYFNGYLTVLSQLLMPARGVLFSGAHLLDLSLAESSISDEDRVRRLISEEQRGILVSCLSGCPWVRRVYTLPKIFSCVESLEMGWSHEDLETLALKIYNLRWKVKKKLGFSWENLVIPEKIFGLESATGFLEQRRLERLIELYRAFVEKGLELKV